VAIKDEVSELVGLYALMGWMKILSSDVVIEAARPVA
jgi:hypothetical protein